MYRMPCRGDPNRRERDGMQSVKVQRSGIIEADQAGPRCVVVD